MKFNIGNKVRCLVDVNGAFSTKGKIGTIVECEYDEEVYLVEFGKNVICYDEENYEFTNGNCLYVREKEIEGFEEDLIFAKVRPEATIPTKREEDAGRDLYPCFDEDYILINPLETKLIPTGIATAFSPKYYAQIQERGSTGSKGIKYGAGVIDSGYRGEWFVPITNCNTIPLVISKLSKEDTEKEVKNHNIIYYPYSKGIAQFVMIEVPEFKEKEVSYEELLEIKSERGIGALGSSNK